MHSGFEIPAAGVHQQGVETTTCAPPAVLLSMNQTSILDQIPNQHIFLDHHFLAHHSRLTHGNHYLADHGGSPYFPVNFKLGLNEVCTAEYKDDVSEAAGSGGDARGSEQFPVPEERHASSLGMLHCWENQEDSAIKPWEAEMSNENSEIVEQHMDMNQKDSPACLDSKCRLHFGELEAIYKRLSNQTAPQNHEISTRLPTGLDHESDAAAATEKNEKKKKRKKKKKKKKKKSGYNHLMSPMMEFFGELVKKVMDHQENLHKKFAEVILRVDEERLRREEAWRNQEMVHFEQVAAARALAESREAMFVSYLEKITGQEIMQLPSFNPNGEDE